MILSVRKNITIIANLLDTEFLIKLSKKNLVLPFYHAVSDNDLIHLKHLYPVISVNRFKKDLDFLQQKYKPISHINLFDQIFCKTNKKENVFFLTFDDGLRQFHDVVAPILIERGIPATCFINSAFIDNKDMFFRLKASVLIEKAQKMQLTRSQYSFIRKLFEQHNLIFHHPVDLLRISDNNKELLDKIAPVIGVDFREYLAVNKPYLSKEQIANLIKQGFSIGAHSVSHPYFPDLDEDAQIEQLRQCIHFIQREFGINDRLFSFPYTDFGIKKTFFSSIKEDVDFTFGTANLKTDEIQTNLQRIPMEIFNSKSAGEIIKTAYLLYILKMVFNKHVIFRD
ncbi:MAG: polysaccharide deacetylase family protein [Paludibacter sp.]|nr:polysaccharide deacetylase family protein [Paludibacter sp.]